LALKKLARRNTPFKFLQIGSSDGDLNDPLRPYIVGKKAVGVFVEPILSSIEALRSGYKDYHGLVFENCAIDSCAGFRSLYQISGEKSCLPEWAYQVASFDRQILLNHADAIPDIASRISEVKVVCRTVDEIVRSNRLEVIDCLQIDTEGYDYKILEGFPFDRIRPSVVIYEHKHLSEKVKTDSVNLMGSLGYSTILTNTDVVAELQ
jgi:FkbM family methyltransferase